jgi:predicted lipid-binding transport protein (Tim44 family)
MGRVIDPPFRADARTNGVKMGQSFSYLDIIFLALVTGFLVLRLRAVLGKRTGAEKPPQETNTQDNDNVVVLPRRNDEDGEPTAPLGSWGKAVGTIDESAESGLQQIRAADGSFDENRFMSGARSAFEMILTAYAKGDIKTLRTLLAEPVYTPFAQAIAARQARGETMVSELISFKTLTLTDAGMDGSNATITLRFVTEQMILIRDAKDAVIDGDPTHIDVVTDDWTFSRDVTSRNPNWLLAVTSTPTV